VLTILIVVFVAVYTLAQLRFLIVCAAGALTKATPPDPAAAMATLPVVAVQVAAYREAPALPGLLGAIFDVEWPRDRFLVQVIDDSSGEDAVATRDVVEQFSNRGVRIDYINRGSRTGFKAGALNRGIAESRGADLIAYFDADCRPRPDFLSRIAPRFADDSVGAVQARWEYPNAERSALTMAQQAAFEYMFRYEYELRARLGVPVFYLGSAAVWRRKTLEAVGGFRTEPLTAEDVDIGYRARAAGWKLLYEPEAVADNDAVEKLLAFRAQQRRWAQAVGRAGLDASGEMLRPKWGLRAWLLEVTAPLAHGTIVLTLATTLLIVLHLVLGGERDAWLNAAEWLFTADLALSPGVFALVLAIRFFHPARWRAHAAILLRAGFVAAATMTSFMFGIWDLARQRRLEFVATPKADQVAVLGNSRFGWLKRIYVPIAFDAAVAAFLLIGAVVAIGQDVPNVAIPALLVGAAYAASFGHSLAAALRHRSHLAGAGVVPATTR
jgi:cellulose synthase/poly-beta-1,6-N-acetylglucosamine synthase-like glycosyltransferase